MQTRRKINVQFESPQHNNESSASVQPSQSEEQSEDVEPLFPLTKSMQNMLYVYGDKKKSDVQDSAHLLLQELIAEVFSPQILHALFSPPTHPWEVPQNKTFNFPEPCHKNKRIMKKYLNFVFKEFVKFYNRHSRISNKLEKQTKEPKEPKEPLDTKKKIDYETTVRNKAELEKIIYEEDLYSMEEESQSNSSVTSESLNSVWEGYMKERVEQMASKEFIKFMEFRSKAFIKNKKFKQFLDYHKYGQNFIESINQKFLNYCLCRIIKRIIQKAMQDEKPKPHQFHLKEEHLKKYGYQIVEIYKIRAKKYALQDQKLNQMAYKLFQSEFTDQGYDEYFKSRLTLTKDGQLSSNQEVRAQEEWEKMGNIRIKWIDRVRAEKQVRQKLVKKMDVVPNNPYSRILLQKVQNKSYDQAKSEFSSIFKEWFIHFQAVKEIDSIYD